MNMPRAHLPAGLHPADRRHLFAIWLRTGRLPTLRDDCVELKFNPWHDPRDGRFTSGPGGAGGTKIALTEDRKLPPVRTREEADAWRAEQLSRYGDRLDNRAAIEARYRVYLRALRAQPHDPLPAALDFAAGVGEGAVDVGRGSAAGLKAALTTNPLTTIAQTNAGVAAMIDGALSAEDTPAHVQLARAADAVANASPRELGHAVGATAAEVGIAVVPGAAINKIARLRRLSALAPREQLLPPDIGWMKEPHTSDAPWVVYNDGAAGARPNQAPTLTRTMPNGKIRPVKFDGIDGDYLIERKLGLQDRAGSRGQMARQAQALEQHRQFAVWEVEDAYHAGVARRMARKVGTRRIKVRIVRP